MIYALVPHIARDCSCGGIRVKMSPLLASIDGNIVYGRTSCYMTVRPRPVPDKAGMELCFLVVLKYRRYLRAGTGSFGTYQV